MRKVLISVVGTSPAVLTETAWCLVKDDWVPDEVVAITTLTGKSAIQEKLLDSGVWNDLREKCGVPESFMRFGGSRSIELIGNGNEDFDDIFDDETNAKTADSILDVIRKFSEIPDTEIVASIAGGRKTMSALMLACMSLLGREQDLVCHVLADEDYFKENRDFCFPKNEDEVLASKIQLSFIPFIRVRGWYEQEYGKNGIPTYSKMVELFRKSAPPSIVEESVVFYEKSKQLFIGDTEIALSDAEFDVAAIFVKDRKSGSMSMISDFIPNEVSEANEANDSFRKCLSRVRDKIKKAGFTQVCARLVPPASEKKYLYKDVKFLKGRPRTSEK